MPTANYRLLLTTAGSDEQARTLAREIVERRLAACVNVVPGVCSFYRWQGQLVEEGERLLLIKSDEAHVEAIRAALRELHSYDTPELIVLTITDGDPDYLAWLGASLTQ